MEKSKLKFVIVELEFRGKRRIRNLFANGEKIVGFNIHHDMITGIRHDD